MLQRLIRKVTYIHKWIPIDHANFVFEVVDVSVSESQAVPNHVAVPALPCFSVAELLHYILNSVELLTTVVRVDDHVLALKFLSLTNDLDHHFLFWLGRCLLGFLLCLHWFNGCSCHL